MSAFTINGGTVAAWDSLSGGSTSATLDTYTISARSTLLIDTDTYQCANHGAAFGSLDTVAFSGSGGTVRIDASSVRVLAYTGGGGTVPAIGTSITQGGVSGPLLGVWADWQSEPLAVGAAMPASGYLKLKAVTGGAFAAGAVAGITATAAGPDVAGWIEVLGADTATITVPRIGRFETVGGWFELGVTTGVAGQVLPCPTTGTVAGVFPAAWIETGPGTGVYRKFVGVGSMPASATIPTDARGLLMWQTTAGIRIGSDGTNNVGFLPPAGCRVRIPNIILTCCTRTAGNGSGPRVLPNATLATRMEFITSAAGEIAISGAVVQWYCNFTQAYSLSINSAAINDSLIAQEISAPLSVTDCAVAPTQAQVNQALNMASIFSGGAITDSTFVRYSIASNAVCIVTSCEGVTFERVRVHPLLFRSGGSAWLAQYSRGCAWTDCEAIGGKWLLTAGGALTFTRTAYADRLEGTTNSTSGQAVIETSGGTDGLMIDGVSWLVPNCNPYNAVVQLSASYDVTVRNVGSEAAPLDLGSGFGAGYFVSLNGNDVGVRVQRCHHAAARIAPLLMLNSDTQLTWDNCSAGYASSQAVSALNSTIRSVKLAHSTAGQTAVYGTHWASAFTSATAGQIIISGNEPTAASAGQCAVTAGTPVFNAQGSVSLRTAGDQVTWEMAFSALGHTELANSAPTLTGTNTGNVSMTFQADVGAGYGGTWLAMTGANLAGIGAIDPAVGVRLKVRATCATANDGNLLTRVAIATVTTAVAQEILYPLEVATVRVENLSAGSRVKAYKISDGSVIANTTETGGVVVFDTEYIGAIGIDARNASAPPYYSPWVTQLTTAANQTSTAVALQQLDQ